MTYEQGIRDLVAGLGTWFHDESRLRDGRMTAELYPYHMLFSPVQVNSIRLKNRIVMGPMGNVSMVDSTGRPTAKMIEYFAERARGGAGLITSGLVPVSFSEDPSLLEPGDQTYLPRIDGSRTLFAGWRDLAEGIHAHGAHFFIQLTAGVGRVGSPECLVKRHKLPISASWNPNFYMPSIPCRPLTDHQCRKIIRAAGQAAADAKACLCDGVYLHGHEGYLLEQMTNPAFNRRRLGAFRDWQAFGLAMVEEVRERCGSRYPIMYRIDLSLALRATYGEQLDRVHCMRRFGAERTVEMTLAYMANLVKAGVDLFDVDLGCYDNWWLPHPPGPMPPGCFLPVAKIAKDYIAANGVRSNAGLDVPVVAVGKLGYPDLAERVLREGLCDLIMLARPLLADPDWPRKAYAGDVARIRPCIGDQEGCINEFIHGGHIQCAVNPRTGFEELLPAQVPLAPVRKRVAVVGAGPAGILCACTAAERGHSVTLLSDAERVGGMLVPGSVPRIKLDVANYLDYLEQLLSDHEAAYGLQVRRGVAADVDALQAGQFDAVVLCTGAGSLRPNVVGIDLPHVVQAIDLLRSPAPHTGVTHAVIVGGGEVGCETAFFLAAEHGRRVTVVEMLPYFMKEACTSNRGYLIHYLKRLGVVLLNCTRLESIQECTVSLLRNTSPTVPDPYVTWSPVLPENVKNPLARPLRVREEPISLEADLVVLATGLRADDSLYRACLQAHVAPELCAIGDAFSPGRILEATRAGYAVGRSL
ncbi:MAG TPA: FAD-dependent oxidoreductase [Anaerolineae bacterium]|nr:FAD-dependent oxidoreductase [Anaerolineae bacterium]